MRLEDTADSVEEWTGCAGVSELKKMYAGGREGWNTSLLLVRNCCSFLLFSSLQPTIAPTSFCRSFSPPSRALQRFRTLYLQSMFGDDLLLAQADFSIVAESPVHTFSRSPTRPCGQILLLLAPPKPW